MEVILLSLRIQSDIIEISLLSLETVSKQEQGSLGFLRKRFPSVNKLENWIFSSSIDPLRLIFRNNSKTSIQKNGRVMWRPILSNVGDEIFKRWTIFWQTYFRGFCQIWGFRAAILYPSQFFFLSQLSIVSCCICLFSMK